LLAHGLAVEAFRARGSDAGRIGITLNLSPAYAASDTPPDRTAAERMDGWYNRWFLDAVYRGAYPQDMTEYYAQQLGATLDVVQASDLKLISAPTDFLAINYYNPQRVTGGSGGPLPQINWLPARGAITAAGWEINPGALHDLLVRIRRDYGDVPILITENGAAFSDAIKDGEIDDPERIAYLYSHLVAVQRAIATGVPVKGYFTWSLLDNFEWNLGYSLRYGITYVDFASQRRTPKRSAAWYRDLIKQNMLAAPPDDVRALVDRHLQTLDRP
jgi:beta-glucosidase